jgi:hypothetical protein
MRRLILMLGATISLGAPALPGCKTSQNTPPYPADPLFVNKKPVEGKARQTGPVTVAHVEPDPPPAPGCPPALRPACGHAVSPTLASHRSAPQGF